MDELLRHPAAQAGIAPLLVALAVAAALWRTPLAWLAVAAAYATAVTLSVGFALQPLTAGRKVTLLIVLAALLGAALDTLRPPVRWLVPLLGIAGGLLSWWAFASVLGQREWGERTWIALGLFLFVAAHTALLLRLSADGAAAGAADVAGGIGIGIAALWSASIGYFVGGVAMAAGAGCGLAAASPSRGLSPDTKGPLDLSCLAKGRAQGRAAACKAHQRTGRAGSAVSA